tara:strand:- start:230 stop:580 length:351 start_codon:yes stop_codon:yes gene_type:complete
MSILANKSFEVATRNLTDSSYGIQEVFLCEEGVTLRDAIENERPFLHFTFHTGYRPVLHVRRGGFDHFFDHSDDPQSQDLIDWVAGLITRQNGNFTTYVDRTGDNPRVCHEDRREI